MSPKYKRFESSRRTSGLNALLEMTLNAFMKAEQASYLD